MPLGSSRGKILVVDDEKNITLVIQAILEREGMTVEAFNDSTQALQRLSQDADFDLVITDLYMPGPGGMEILKECQKNYPELPVVMITAFGTVESAVNALKQGAFDFITKPFEQSDLLQAVHKAVLTSQQRKREPILLPTANQPQPEIGTIVGSSPLIQEVLRVVQKVASSPSTVLIRGESGTGKELIAYEIHRLSNRNTKPFIRINCAAIPATLIESELFGYEKGAFTGAVTSKPGRFELANDGTLFLDEVADMPLEMQVKLLRVLQEQEFERVGGVQLLKVDVRIITATNKDLDAEVKAGRFREDLFYRLNVVPIELPSLRERKEDIEVLVKTFLVRFNQKLGKKIIGVDALCMSALKSYAWPGNIRQLENALERMVLMSDGDILEVQDLPNEILIAAGLSPQTLQTDAGDLPESGVNFKDRVKAHTQQYEKQLIEKALEKHDGNVTHTAEHLGLSRKGLQLKMKELGLKPDSDS